MHAKPPCSSPAMAVHSPSPSTATGSAAAVPAYQRQSDRPPGLYTYTPSRATKGATAITQKRHINCVRDSDHALPGDVRRHRTGLQRFRQPVLESNTGTDLLSLDMSRRLGNTRASQGRSACECKWPAAAAPVRQRASSGTRAGSVSTGLSHGGQSPVGQAQSTHTHIRTHPYQPV